jgi:uncharacterized repeat protein (TIGR04042 family)
MYFRVRWPDGEVESCYSPSTIIGQSLSAGESYRLAEFLVRSSEGLSRASARVQAKHGMPCSRALGQLARIESACRRFGAVENAEVTVLSITASAEGGFL